MSGDVHTPTNAGPEPVVPIPGEAAVGAQPPESGGVDVDEHPEILVGAAFVGGVIAAFLLKRLASDDD